MNFKTKKLKLHCASKNRQFIESESIRFSEPNIIPGMDVGHRWNSSYDLLRSALRIKQSLGSLSVEIIREKKSGIYKNIDEEDWKNVSLICNFLEPFKQGTCFYLL